MGMLAIAGGKGGCGKTTTALGLGAALSGTPVVADADWDLPNLHRLARTYRDGRVDDDDPIRTTAGPTTGETVEVADGVSVRIDRLGGATVVPAPATPGDRDLSTWLDGVRDEFTVTDGDHREPVLVDCPAGASPDATRPLAAADATVLVTTPRRAAVRDTVKTAAMARALAAEPVGVVVVGADSAPRGTGDALDTTVLGCVPSANPPVLGRPAVARAYRRVAARLGDRLSGASDPRSGRRTSDDTARFGGSRPTGPPGN